VLHLTSDEWTELVASIDSKAALAERGDYGEEDPEEDFDPKKWSEDLEALSSKVQEQLHSQNVSF